MKLTFLFTLLFVSPLAASDYIKAAVRVNEDKASCGTIVKSEEHRVWVLSTGHMLIRNEPVVEVFYRDGKKLKKPLSAKGKLILRVENNLDRGIDFSLIEVSFGDVDHRKFKSVPIGEAKSGLKCTSIGCDLAIKPKVFKMTIFEVRKDRDDIYTLAKKPINGGRSGGGLFHKGKLIGICWGATTAGFERGIYTSGQSIRRAMIACGYGHVLEGK